MEYGIKEYNLIMRLLLKYNAVFATHKDYEGFIRDLTSVFKV